MVKSIVESTLKKPYEETKIDKFTFFVAQTVGKHPFLINCTKKSDIFIFLVTVSRQNKQCGHFLKNPNIGQERLKSNPK